MRIDSHGLKNQKIVAMLEEYDQARIWLESIGVRVAVTRFQKYRKCIEHAFLKNSFKSPSDPEVLWALAELHDLLDIYLYLKPLDESRVNDTLKKIKGGPALLVDEKNDGGSVHGRNFTFELYTASRFMRGGLNVSWYSEADINLLVRGTNVHVECKRVVSEKNLEKLVEKALHQVDTRCSSCPNDRGIVALSISKLAWKAQQKLDIGCYSEVDTMQAVLAPVAQNFSKELTSRYLDYSKKNIGIMFHYKLPFFRKSNGEPAIINRFSYVPFSKKGTEDRLISDEFSKALKASVYK